MKQTALFAAFLLGWNALAAQAQSAAATRPVQLKDAVDLALVNSAQIRKARLDRQALDERLLEQRSAALPQVRIGANFDVFPVLPTQLIPGEVLGRPDDAFVPVQFGRPWQLTSSLSAEQILYSEAGRRMAPAAETTRAVSDLLVERSADEVRYQTAALFLQFLQTRQLQRSVDANLDKLAQLQKMADLQRNNGYLTGTDVKRIQVARTNLQTQRTNLLTALDALRETLQMLCGVPFDEPFEPTDDTLRLVAPAADSARWLALQPHPEASLEYRLLARQDELNRIVARAAKAENWPTLSAYATGWAQSQRNNPNFFDVSKRWFGMAAVGLRAQAPLFDGFRLKHKLAVLGIENQKISEDRRQLTAGKTLEFRQAQSQLRAALGSLRTQIDNRALALEVRDKLALQYREGVAPLSDLLSAQTASSEAETNYWQQVFAYRLAVLRLAKTAGLLEEAVK